MGKNKGRGWESCYVKKIYGMFGVEMRAYGQKFVKFCTQTMERKKRSKGRGLESCYVKKIYGMFGVEMRAYGQKLVKFCTQKAVQR